MNMKKTNSNYFRSLALAAVSLGMSGAAHGDLIEIKFATGPIALVTTNNTTTDAYASQQAFLAALSNNSLTPANFGGVSGVLFYESTTAGNGGSPIQTFNGAVDSLSFTCGQLVLPVTDGYRKQRRHRGGKRWLCSI